MKRGNPGIGTAGSAYAAERRRQSEAKIAGAKERLKARILKGETFGDRGMTIQKLLEEAGLNPTYLEGEDRREAKKDVKDWIVLARQRFVKPGRPKPIVAEDRLTTLMAEFKKMQNAYVAAQLVYTDRGHQLKDAEERIEKLEDEKRLLVQRLSEIQASA